MSESINLYASVYLPVPINEPFTYSVPESFSGLAEFGKRALAPFGRHVLTGFIADISDNPGDVPTEKIKPLVEIIDDEPVFDSDMLELARWTARYYLCSTGDVLRAAMPGGTMAKSRVRIYLENNYKDVNAIPAELSEIQSRIIEIMREKGDMLLREIARKAGGNVSGAVDALAGKGILRREYEMSAASVRRKTERHVMISGEKEFPADSRAKEQNRLFVILSENPDGYPLSEILERYGFSRGVVNSLVTSGLAVYEDVDIERKPRILDQESMFVEHPLSMGQKKCFETITGEISGNRLPVLIKGVTGSGKTRVYIEVAKDMLSRGKSTLILVPEISLTPQTTRFFTSVFPGRVAVMHSAMSPGERFDMWHTVKRGDCDVVIGPRSAVFAPLKSPGAIIVDEEHDVSYKQTDTAPRYNARDIAVMRGKILGIPVILGSATPSLESWNNAKTGKYVLAEMSERVESRPLPKVFIADMKEERKKGNLSNFSEILREELKLRVEKGEKSILLVNRRGYSPGVQCRDCGAMVKCPNCSAAMKYHSSKKLLVCHLCGNSRIMLEHCQECGSTNIQYRGAGTQRIEQELVNIIGDRTVVRMDSDTTAHHDAHYKLLEEFRNSDAPVLLGTQMVAKGLDFPEVTLVGIISADSGLYMPDFRAAERTFQLITQVAGRAGRGTAPGTVILQAYNTDNYALSAGASQDYDFFAERELEERNETGFPPFSRLILIEISSEDRLKAEKTAESVMEYLLSRNMGDAEVMGPVDAPVAVIRNRQRKHILVKTRKITGVLPKVGALMKVVPGAAGIVTIDVDPMDMI